jgi:hypothetical protein
MSSRYKTRKTLLQRQITGRLALAIARPTFDITHATERWQVAQQTVQFAP